MSQTEKSISYDFAESLRRAMRVSDTTEDGEPASLAQHALAERSGVARSTIANCLSNKPDGSMKLETICKLAQALNVPPAFLLMRCEDWESLVQAIHYLVEAARDAKFSKAIQELSAVKVGNPLEVAQASLHLATIFDLYREPTNTFDMEEKYRAQIKLINNASRNGIVATAALPPFGKMKKSSFATLLSICAIIGASNQHNEMEI